MSKEKSGLRELFDKKLEEWKATKGEEANKELMGEVMYWGSVIPVRRTL